jgi:hypothetical protein
MNPTRLILVVLILAGLTAGAWWLVEREPATPAAPDGPPPVGLLGSRTDQLESVVVHLPDRPTIVRVSRGGDGRWRLEEPWIDRADSAAVGRLLNSVRISPPRPLREDWRGHSDADLGLDPPAFTVEYEMAGGEIHELKVGAPDLSGQFHAASFDGERIMVGVADARVYQRMTIQWRDQAVFAEPASVRRIEWLPADGDGFVVEKQGTRWRMTAPESFLLSPTAEGLLHRMLAARVGVLPEEVVLPGERELIEQEDRIVTEAGDRRTTLWLSGAVVLPEDRPYLMPVVQDDFQFVRLPREQLRSPFLFDLAPNEVVSMLLEVDGVEHRFRRRAPGWFDGDGELVDDARQTFFDELVERVCTVRAQRPGLARPQAPPAGRVVLSRSLEPKARSGAELWWWVQEAGMPLAAEAAGGEATELGFNLDAGVRGLLPR